MAAEKLQLEDEFEMLTAELQRSQLQSDELEKQNRMLRENLEHLISVVERESSQAEQERHELHQRRGTDMGWRTVIPALKNDSLDFPQ